MSAVDIAVIGPLLVDEITYLKHSTIHAGGSALYATLAARLLGLRVGLVSTIGHDFPKDVLKKLEDENIDLTGVKRLTGPSCRCVIHVEGNKRWYEHPAETLSFPDACPTPNMIPKLYYAAKAIHVSPCLYNKQMDMLDHLKKNTTATITVDPVAIVPDDHCDAYIKKLQTADFFMPSVEEYERFCKSTDPSTGIRELAQKNMKGLILKCGKEGVIALDVQKNNITRQVPLNISNVVDTNGAGDSFCGAFMAAWAKTRDFDYAIKAGNVAASFVIEAPGAERLLSLTQEEFMERLNHFNNNS